MSNITIKIITILWAWYTWYLTTTPNLVVAPDNLLNSLIMNGGHFVFFGILAVLLKLNKLKTTHTILITSIYGAIIELVQRSIIGRSADPMDWVLDTLGAIIFIAIMNKILNHKS